MNEIATVHGSGLMPTDLDQAMRLASFMAKAKTVPAHLQDSPGDCLMVIEASMRWQMSPFAVAQCTSVIQGKLMFEGKLVAAVVETSGGIVGHLDYQYEGAGAERSITVSAVRRGETTPRTVTVALKDARTNNGIWTKQPDQQLVYHATRVWARRWLPAVMLGVYSPEEMPDPPFNGTTIEAEPAHIQMGTSAANPVPAQEGTQRAAAAAMPRTDRVIDKSEIYKAPPAKNGTKPRQRGYREILDALRIALREAQSAEEVHRILENEEIQTAKTTFKDDAADELNRLEAEAIKRWWHEPTTTEAEEELPDLAEIALP